MADHLRIYGHSDDNVEIEGWLREEIGCYDEPVRIEIGSPMSGGIAVVAEYAAGHRGGATWSIAFAPLDEEVPCPWDVEFDPEGNGKGYSFGLIVHCPKGTPIRAWVGEKEHRL